MRNETFHKIDDRCKVLLDSATNSGVSKATTISVLFAGERSNIHCVDDFKVALRKSRRV